MKNFYNGKDSYPAKIFYNVDRKMPRYFLSTRKYNR